MTSEIYSFESKVNLKNEQKGGIVQAPEPLQCSTGDTLIMSKGHNNNNNINNRNDFLPPIRRPSSDALYLQLLLSASGSSAATSSATSSSSSILTNNPTPTKFQLPSDRSADTAKIRRTQSYDDCTVRQTQTPAQLLTTSRSHAQRFNRDFRRIPAPPPRPGKCPHCNVVLKWPNGLRKHVQNIHDARTTEFHCERCSFKHKSKNALRDHEDHIHHTCPYCKAKFTRLLQHMPYCSKRPSPAAAPNPSV